MRKFVILILMFSLLLTGTFTYANSGPTYWEGYPSSEILTIEENSPISVEKEDLIFDFTRDEAIDHPSYSISSLVTAKYTMYNSSEDGQGVQMAFPLISKIEDFNPEGIDIEVDGEKIPYQLFIGDTVDLSGRKNDNVEQWDFSTIVKSISSSEYKPKNYDLDEIGTLYTYDITSTGDAINIGIDYTYDKEKSRIMSKGFNGYQFKDDMETIMAWVREKEELEVFVLGQDVDLNFNAYKDGELTEETDEYSLDIKTEKISIGDYLAREIEVFNSNINYLDYLADNQTSNQITKLLDELIERDVVNLGMDELFSLDYMERYFVLIYEVEFQPHDSKGISVSYISEGTMDRIKTSKPTYTFDYILNPAENWASFKNLNIEIKPSSEYPYIIDSSIDLERKEDGTYAASFETLPEEDLSFSLYHRKELSSIDKVKDFLGPFLYFITSMVPFVVGALIGFIISKIYRRVKKSWES